MKNWKTVYFNHLEIKQKSLNDYFSECSKKIKKIKKNYGLLSQKKKSNNSLVNRFFITYAFDWENDISIPHKFPHEKFTIKLRVDIQYNNRYPCRFLTVNKMSKFRFKCFSFVFFCRISIWNKHWNYRKSHYNTNISSPPPSKY